EETSPSGGWPMHRKTKNSKTNLTQLSAFPPSGPGISLHVRSLPNLFYRPTLAHFRPISVHHRPTSTLFLAHCVLPDRRPQGTSELGQPALRPPLALPLLSCARTSILSKDAW